MSDFQGNQTKKGDAMNRREMLTQLEGETERNLPSLGARQALGLGLVSQGWGQLRKLAAADQTLAEQSALGCTAGG